MVFKVPLGQLQVGCHVPFTEESLLSGHSWWRVAEIGEPSRKTTITTEDLELRKSNHWVLGHLPAPGPSSPNCSV